MKKIVILGPESVGKSTMIKRLANLYGTEYIKEFGRTYTELTGTDGLQIFDFEAIAHWHNRHIEQAKECDFLFIDTEAITTKIFAEMYLGKCDSKYIDEIINKQVFDLCLVLNVDVPWVDDGTRDFPEGREEHLATIIKELEDRGRKYVLITGVDYEERFYKVVAEIEYLRLIELEKLIF